jgi:hypothetical protein
MEGSKVKDIEFLSMVRLFCCIGWGAGAFFPNMISTASFWLHSRLGHTIDLSNVYLALTFFERIKGPMGDLGASKNGHKDIVLCMWRVQKYLDLPELPFEKVIK